MKVKTKQKRLLKKEVFENLEFEDWSVYESVMNEVHDTISECSEKLSNLLSNYFLNWEGIRYQRDEIVLKELQNDYTDIPKKEMKKLIIQYIKEYWNSERCKSSFGEILSEYLDIEDSDY